MARSPKAFAGASAAPGLPVSFPEHVRRQLREAIIDGTLEPGQHVSEHGLARTLGVSRTPVREAMRSLESEGLIIHHRGRGAIVAKRATARDAEVLFRVRITLESALTRQAAESMTAAQFVHLREVQAAFAKALRSGMDDNAAGVQQLVSLDLDFHWTIYSSAETDLLLPICRSYWGQLGRELTRPDHSPDHPVQFVAEHARLLEQHDRIVRALEDRDGEGAEAIMTEHLRSAWEQMRS